MKKYHFVFIHWNNMLAEWAKTQAGAKDSRWSLWVKDDATTIVSVISQNVERFTFLSLRLSRKCEIKRPFHTTPKAVTTNTFWNIWYIFDSHGPVAWFLYIRTQFCPLWYALLSCSCHPCACSCLYVKILALFCTLWNYGDCDVAVCRLM